MCERIAKVQHVVDVAGRKMRRWYGQGEKLPRDGDEDDVRKG